MPRPHLIVDLSPARLEVALCRGGRVVATRRVMFDRSGWSSLAAPALTTRPDGVSSSVLPLHELDAPLRKAVQQLTESDKQLFPCTIVYDAPGSVTSVAACPLAAGPSQALTAARLSLSSVAPFKLSNNPHDEQLLCTGRRGSVASRGDSGDPASSSRIHTLSCADTDATVSELTRWASNAGLSVESLVPAEAVISAAAAEAARSSGQTQAALWLGLHQSVLAVSVAGRLELVRTINAGTESLVESLLRPIRRRASDTAKTATTIQLDREKARVLLSNVGVPAPETVVADLPGCDGACILPLLQPVVQRLAVELKQSLRFGMPEADRTGLVLSVLGEGAAIPGLADAIGKYAGVPMIASAEATSLTWATVRNAAQLPRLISVCAGEDLTRRGLRRGLLAGVAAAGMLMAVQGVAVFASLAKERERLTAIRTSSAGSEALANVQQGALEARVQSTALDARIASTLGDSPDWAVIMRVMAEKAPRSIRILDMEMGADGTRHHCRLNAYIRLSDTDDAAADIRQFVEQLLSQPVIESVKLGLTQRTTVRGHDSQAFELSIGLVPVPNGPDASSSVGSPANAPADPPSTPGSASRGVLP